MPVHREGAASRYQGSQGGLSQGPPQLEVEGSCPPCYLEQKHRRGEGRGSHLCLCHAPLLREGLLSERSVCVCAQLCACVYCMKGWHTPTPAVAEVSGTPPPISGSHPPPAWQPQPGWEVASLETWLLGSERTFWRLLSLTCIMKLKVLLPC